MATSSSIVVCTHCSCQLEPDDGYNCACEEASGSQNSDESSRYFCEACILVHVKTKHVLKNRKGNDLATCRSHSISASSYCRTERRLVCVQCLCQRMNHDCVSISEEAIRFRTKVFEFCSHLESGEKELNMRKDMDVSLLSDKQKQREKFEMFVHDTMVALEQKIKSTKLNADDGSDEKKVEQTINEAGSCIERTLYFQKKLRNFLALSQGALVEQFVDDEEQVVFIIKEQERLTNLVSFSEPNFQQFDTTSFIQETADQFLTKIKLPILQEVVSTDLTVEQNVEIENLDEIQNELKTSGVFLMSYVFGFYLVRKQLDAEVYDWQYIVFKEIPLPNEVESDTSGMSKSIVRLEKKWTLPIPTIIESTLSCVHWYSNQCMLVFENGSYCLYDKSQNTVVKTAEIGYVHALHPVQIIGSSYEVEWAYWDEDEKVIRISGKDGLKIPCKQKPTVISQPCDPGGNNYGIFAVVNEDSDVLIINPNVDEYLFVIPQTQHTLRRIDLVCHNSSSIQLYDLNSNREVVLNFNLNAWNSGCTIKSVGHWAKSNCATVNLNDFGNCLFAFYNIGTPENPEIKKTLLRKD